MTNHLYDHLLAPHADNPAPFLMRQDAPDLSFADFVATAARLAHRLTGIGIRPGDRVVVQAAKTVEMVALYAACVQAGAVFLPLNTGYTTEEIAYFIGDAAPRAVICDGNRAEDIRGIAGDAAVLTLDPDGSGTLTKGLNALPARFQTVARAPDDLAALLYTSGTTGRSKGAMLGHENLLSNTRALVDLWRITAQDTLAHALPIFHTHGLFVALNTCLLAGASVHFMPRFDPDGLLEVLPRSTLLMGVPTFYTRLLADDRLTRARVAGMRLFISGSAPLLAETHAAFTARTGHAILERYGMTETNMNTSNPYDGERRPGTVGHPLPGVELCLTDPETGKPVADGSVGMIEVRGPNVFQGYWQMPEKTAEELRDDGFFITGDLGQVDADGYLSIVGREKDLIITGGYNVYPKEVEDVLNAVPGVNESAVIGVPDPDFGEAIVAVIDARDKGLSEDIIRDAVRGRLARFKHPGRYEWIDALPRNTMGKVQKAALRKKFGPSDPA